MRRLWWLPGLAMVLVGVALFLTGGSGLGDDGAFTYDHPMTVTDWSVPSSHPSAPLPWLWVTRAQLAGAAVAVLGLMALAAGAGFQWGRRTPAALEP